MVERRNGCVFLAESLKAHILSHLILIGPYAILVWKLYLFGLEIAT